jgi:hypothetical protein
MSLLAVVTFDLHGATATHYKALRDKLSKIGLEPEIDRAAGSTLTRLPNNMYAGKFPGKKTDAVWIRNILRKKIANEITRLNLDGTVLVVVGIGWAWGQKTIRRRIRRAAMRGTRKRLP